MLSLDTKQDNRDLERAVQVLEFPTFTAKVSKSIGKPVEFAMKSLPSAVVNRIGRYTQTSLEVAFRVVLTTIDKKRRHKKSNNFFHKGMVVASGGVGGFLGSATLAVELPISTGIMMRSIADVAREEGEDLTALEPQLACISVLGMDPSSHDGDDKTSASRYFMIRATLAKEVSKAAEYLVANSVTDSAAPIVVKLMSRVCERFGVQLTQKIAAELVPVVGAVSGATINYLFIDHFQRLARGHFIVRRLERVYGYDRVHMEYEAALRSVQHGKSKEPSSIREVAATSED